MTPLPRAVLVRRRSELDELLDRYGTRGAVDFVLRARGRGLGDVQDRHDHQQEALRQARAGVPEPWRRGEVEREDLARFPFEPGDVVVVVGPDGLVANAAKYLDAQPVVGVDPEPGRNPGVLVRHRPDAVADLLRRVAAGTAPVERRVMVRADLDDGQVLHALNDVYLGHAGHQSSRYRLHQEGDDGWPAPGERQSSSGLVVATGTGATGWAASLTRGRARPVELPGPTQPALAWFVREAWPSPVTGTDHTEGRLVPGARLVADVETDSLVVFGDGLEADRLTVAWGQSVTIGASDRVLRLVSG
jgi:hypothetical protein